MDRGVLDQKPFQFLAKWKEYAEREFLRPLDRPRRSTRMPGVSVIIPAHNEERYIRATLRSLQKQDYPHMEVIVVTNGCTDRTASVARGHCDRLIDLSQKSLGVSRNLGARMAKNQILVFLDADTLLPREGIRRIAENFKSHCAAGTVKGKPDGTAVSHRVLYLLKNTVHKLRLHPGSSGVIICWKEHFFAEGGFDEGLEVRENSELMRRLLHFGGYKYIKEVEAVTSMRRYQQKGLASITWLWVKVWFQTHFGDLHRRRYEIVR